MGIYLIQKGTISCDKCKKNIAKVRASREVMENLEKHPLEILCAECEPIPADADYVEKV